MKAEITVTTNEVVMVQCLDNNGATISVLALQDCVDILTIRSLVERMDNGAEKKK